MVHVCLDELDDLVLLMAGQPVSLLEGLAEFAGWALGDGLAGVGTASKVVQ